LVRNRNGCSTTRTFRGKRGHHTIRETIAIQVDRNVATWRSKVDTGAEV
jgi:hypothetical protein